MRTAPPFNLHRWIDENRHLLKPPVGNKLLFRDSDFIVMAVGGPNARADFHHDPSEEFFYQVEGDMVLRTVQDGRLTMCRSAKAVFRCREVPHSPQRRRKRRHRGRAAPQSDGTGWLSWYCERCGHCLYLERVAVRDIETQLPEIFARFYSNIAHRACGACGNVMQAPSK
jgi:3-hydroxyanthranilate 3,4-dioxygenase